MPFVIGGAAAAVLLLYSLVVIDGYSMPLTAIHWWTARLVIEGLQGATAVLVVRFAAPEAQGVGGVAAWIVAGLCAPQLIRRMRYGDPTGSGFAFDLQDLFDRLVFPLREGIDGASAAKQSQTDRRLVERLMRSDVTPPVLADYLISVIRRRKALETRTSDALYIRRISKSGDPPATKLLVMVERARALRILWSVRQLARVGAQRYKRA